MTRCLFIPLLVASLALPAAAQEAEPAPPTLEQVKAKDMAQSIAEIAALPVHKADKVADVIDIQLKNKLLHIRTSLPASLEQVRIQAPGLSGITTMRLSDVTTSGNPIVTFTLENVDYNTTEGISLNTSVYYTPVHLNISQDLVTIDDQTNSVQLIQATGALGEGQPQVTLHVQVTGDEPVSLQIQAANMIELRSTHPAEVAKYVDPIFKTLRQEGLLAVDSKLAWQVFADAFQPSDDLTSTLKAILARLNAEKFADREAASAELEQLGQPAALALMRWERRGLNDEQLGRIDAFLASFRLIDEAEIERRRKDPDFLLDCLYSEDAAIRRRALEELRKVTDKNVAFDIEAEPEQRLEAIARLRDSLGAAPATQAKRTLDDEP